MSKSYTINVVCSTEFVSLNVKYLIRLLFQATHLTGLLKARNPHFTLTTVYNKILGTVARMPKEAGYRKHTERIINERLAIVAAEKNIEVVEEKLKTGTAEELIVQAENELVLARKMLEWKPWEPLVAQPPPNQWKWPV